MLGMWEIGTISVSTPTSCDKALNGTILSEIYLIDVGHLANRSTQVSSNSAKTSWIWPTYAGGI